MDKSVRLARDIEFDSVANGPGLRAVIWFQGCLHNCKGCHNPETQPIDGGFTKDIDDIVNQIKEADYLDGVTLTGGEPFFQVQKLKILLPQLKELGLSIWMYSGSTFEVLRNKQDFIEITPYLDVLIDGPFILDQLNLDFVFRGSENQRIIDVQASLNNNEVIELPY